jgi:hypothetical protein
MRPVKSYVRVPYVLAVLVTGVTSISGCTNASGPSNRNVSVSFATLVSAPAAAAPRGGQPALDVQVGGHTLSIASAQVVLSRIELAASTTTQCDSATSGDESGSLDMNGGEHHDCEQIELGPTLVNLPVDSTVITPLALGIPAGTYSALEAKLHPITSGDANDATFLTAHPEFSGVSVRVTGTFDGASFTYSGSPTAHLELEFNPPVVVDNTTNITVHIALDRWFENPDGSLIDPATANASGQNASVVANNIQNSFRAFRDDDHRGDDGHGDGH